MSYVSSLQLCLLSAKEISYVMWVFIGKNYRKIAMSYGPFATVPFMG